MRCNECKGTGKIECQPCNGSGKVDNVPCKVCGQTGNISCPVCSASKFRGDAVSVTWDDFRKEYDVLLVFSENDAVPSELLPELPAIIAKDSMCSCGGQLRLASHSIERNQAGATFKGKFVCTVCNGADRPVLTKVQSSIQSVWRSIKRIKVGGIEFEKDGQQSR